MRCPLNKLVTSGAHEHDSFLHRMAFAGQVLGAYACLGPLSNAVASSDTTTWLSIVAVWKEGAATAAGVYATASMCAARETGETAATNADGSWVVNRPYTLTNEVVSRRTLAAGDKLYLRTKYQHDSTGLGATVQEDISIQVDYIYGLETA
jgi:hypothetical protein